MRARPRIVLVSGELHPFDRGGIAPIVAAAARTLSALGDVTLVTTDRHRAEAERRGGAEALYGAGVELLFADGTPPEGRAAEGWAAWAQTFSGRVFEALAARFAGRGPDLIEFCDYMGEGFVTLQARRTGEPWLRDTRIVVRTHTTAELAAILDGALRSDNATVAVGEIERYALRHADALLHSGGDVRATYERFYGADALAPARTVLEAFHAEFEPVAGAPTPEGRLRVLFLGRLERRKGVQNLLRALRGSDADLELSLLGADTATAPLGRGMREQLELAAAGDERVRFLEPVPRERVGAAIEAHDVVVVPSLWECWPNVVREAFLHNRPVLATPTGGLVELVEPGVSGWLAGGTSARALRRELDTLAERPEHARELIAAGGPRRAFDRVADPERTRREYAALLAEPRPSPPPAARRPAGGVSVVVPYFRLDAHVEETLDSIAAQTVPVLEVVVVNDGSLREADGIVDRLAAERGLRLVTRPNAGLAAARNLGVAVARGDFVLPLDADNVLEPDFVERCLHALARDERLAYATSWTRWIDEHGVPLGDGLGHQPLGNWTSLVERNNWAGDGTALIRRAVFDAGLAYDVELTSYEDWFLYRQMHHAGLLGDVIPRRLLRYRVRAASMVRTVGLPHEARIYDEMTARLAEWRMTWTA